MNKKVIVGLILTLVIFLVPYLSPSNEIVVSMSYDHGFNNKVGTLLVLFSAGIFVLWAFSEGRKAEYSIFDSSKALLSHCYFRWGAATYVIYCTLVVLLCGNYMIYGGGESSYFLPHLYDMSYGKMPYTNFMFFYGPLMIYVPYWLYCIVPGLSILWAYTFSVVLFSVIGLWMLYQVINAIYLDIKAKKWLFILIAIFALPYAVGMNYELLRFVLPFWCFWRLHQLENAKWRVFLYPVSVIMTLAISPEIGLVYLIALMIYCIAQYVVTRQSIYLSIAAMSLMLTVFFMVVYSEMFMYLLSFSSGLLNFPFTVSFYLIVFFISIFLLSFHAGTLICQWKKHVFELSFIILSFGLIPACLGRCDPGHVLYNGLFILPMAMALVWVKADKRYRKVLLAIAVVMYGLPLIYTLRAYGPLYAQNTILNNISTAYDHLDFLKERMKQVGVSQEKIAKFEEKVIKSHISEAKSALPKDFLPDSISIALPLDMPKVHFELSEKGKLIDLYIPRLSFSGDTKSVQRTIDDLESKKPAYLMMNETWKNITKPTDNTMYIRYLFVTYYPLKPYRNGNEVFQPLINYIDNNYKVVNIEDNLLLYKRL